MNKLALVDIHDDGELDEAIEMLLDALGVEKHYEERDGIPFIVQFDWDESKVNRHPAGSSEGGQFAPKDGGSYVSEGANAGPGFTPEELTERDRLIKRLEDVGRNWMHERTDGKEPSRKDLADMMRFLGQSHAAELDAVIKDFDDYSKYPERPAIHLTVGEKGVPDVWLLGWRENERGLEATPIHDHGPSEAGVYVHKGAVNERIFAIDKADGFKDEIEFREVDRGLDNGSAITINAPYLHDIGAQKGAGTSVTLHAYYPPLNDMNFYEVKGSKLLKTGNWKEDPKVMKAKGFDRSHVFPCFHYSINKYHDPNETSFIHAYEWDESKHPRDERGRWVDSHGVLHGETQDTLGTTEGGQRQLPGVPRNPVSLISAERQKTKSYLGSGSIEGEERLGGGANETLRLTIETPDGPMDAVFKPADGERSGLRDDIPGEYYLREAAASDIAEVMGLDDVVPPVVVREIDGRVGSLHEYRNNELTVARDKYNPFDVIANDQEIARVAAFDYLIGNQDRHNGNWLVNENSGDYVLIDHGLAFPESNDWGIRSNFMVNVRDKDLLVRDGVDDSWDSKWPEIARVMREKKFNPEVTLQMKKRYDELISAKNSGAAFGDLNLTIQYW